MANETIGVFDSGIGGLTVLKELVRFAPELNYCYFGDNEHAPYGNKSEEEIRARVRDTLNIFRAIGVSAAVLACNTATAVAIDPMRREFSFPMIGTEPAIALAAKKYRKILVLCTPATAKSGRIHRLAAAFPEREIRVAPVEELALAVERAALYGEEKRVALPDFSPEFVPECVVLGCTHYAFVKEQISAFYGVETVSGESGVARRIRALFPPENSAKKGEKRGFEGGEKFDLGTNGNYPNKSLQNCEIRAKSDIMVQITPKSRVFFLGSSAKTNKNLFERMFGFHNIVIKMKFFSKKCP